MRSLVCLLLVVGFAGCAVGDKVKSLEPGMTKQQVLHRLGKPDGYLANGNVETLSYTNVPMNWNGPDRADYDVTLTNGILTGYGPRNVRQPNVTPVLLMGNVTTN